MLLNVQIIVNKICHECGFQLSRREADSYEHIVSEDCLTKAIHPLQ